MKPIAFASVLLMVAGVAFAQGTTSIGGYGELHFNKNTYSPGKPEKDRVGLFDFHRFVLYVGHDFNDWVSFKSELELEHTQVKSSNSQSEVALEQAFIDLKFSKPIGFRAGIFLIPVGFINEFHEPNTFNGVERPSVDRVLIPTTWREAGIGIYGEVMEGISYRLYYVAGLNPQKMNEKGIRDTRQSGYYSQADDMALTGRIEFLPLPELKTGFSFYTSSLELNSVYADTLSGSRFTLLEGDVRYQVGDLSLKAVGVYSMVSEATKLVTELKKNIGDSQMGYYVEAGYNILPAFLPDSEQSLTLFTRFEEYNTQYSLSAPAVKVAGTDVNEFTAGITWLPHPNVALKADYQWIDASGSPDMTQKLNLGIGYYFY
ncbi:MAG: porin [Bacteroidetes bacterium]|nr:porin [Bacteroidota bacterium]